MKNILSNWNFMRILRLVMAVFIIFQGFETEQWLFVIAGFIFALLPLFNIGCCGTSGCNTNFSSKKDNQNNETTFTEIK
nr:hypothetical protein [uncultured Flavobacterium sp.]